MTKGRIHTHNMEQYIIGITANYITVDAVSELAQLAVNCTANWANSVQAGSSEHRAAFGVYAANAGAWKP